MGTHFNSKHDDGTWRALFGRWHAGEEARALRAEAGVSADTWSANAKRLGMRIGDLAEGHAARRGAPPHAERADDWKHPNSLLSEGEWRALFALRAEAAPDTALCARFGVHKATICSQAKARGVTRPRGWAGDGEVEKGPASPSPLWGGASARSGDGAGFEGAGPRAYGPHPGSPSRLTVPPHKGEGEVLSGVEIVMGDPGRTMASFDAAIAEAGRRRDYVGVTVACRAKLSVKRAMFGDAVPSPPHPVGCADHPPHEGEGEAPVLDPATWADPVLREAQRAPEGEWATWLFLGGRGAGKTLAGAMWLSDQAEALGDGGRLALIGPTLHDVREVMIEGASGILGLPRWRDPKWGGRRPGFEPSRRRLTFPNGATAQVFSAEDPDSLRGPQFSAAWADEWCAWRNGGETLALLRMGLRLPGAAAGRSPRLMLSTTPRPTMALRRLRVEPGCVETHAGTRDNAAHLSGGFVDGLERLYGGTRRAAQEIEGKVVEAAGALFSAEMMMRARAGGSPYDLGSSSPKGGSPYDPASSSPKGGSPYDPASSSPKGGSPHDRGSSSPKGGSPHDRGSSSPKGGSPLERVLVAVDPTATAGGCACGIVVAGVAGEVVWVLEDLSVSGVGPDAWGRRVAAAAERWGAEVVAEVNQGGDMVKAVLRAAGCDARVREVRATKGKRVRAEPVAALYEQGRVRHAGAFDALEEELMALGSEDGLTGTDRADALVWAVTELVLTGPRGGRGPRIRGWGDPPETADWAARPLRLGIAGRDDRLRVLRP